MLSLGVNRILMMTDDKNKKIREFLLKDKFRKIIIFVGILGIALIFISGFLLYFILSTLYHYHA